MRKNLQYGLMISMIAVGMFNANSALAANSGGKVIQNGSIWVYAGTKPQNSAVKVDSPLETKVEGIIGGYSLTGNASSNSLTISNGNLKMFKMITGGASMSGGSTGNVLNITGGTISLDPFGYIAGGVGYNNAANNKVNLSGGIIDGIVYGGYTQNGGTINGNTITVSGKANLNEAALSGGYSFDSDNAKISNNKLVISNWSGSVKNVENFSSIDFQNMQWKNGGTVLKITSGEDNSLANTKINLLSLAGGSKPGVNQSMYIIDGDGTRLGINKQNVTVNKNFSAGVAVV